MEIHMGFVLAAAFVALFGYMHITSPSTRAGLTPEQVDEFIAATLSEPNSKMERN